MKETNLQMAVVPQSFLDKLEEKIENLENILRDKSESEQNSQWIISTEIPKILGVSQKTWQTYRDKRLIPFSQIGSKIFVKREDLENFMNSHYIKSKYEESTMNHYDDFFKEQYDRIQHKLDKIAGDFIYSRQLPEQMFVDNPKFMELMGISQKTAQAWRDKGTISYSQVGNKIYYRISDIKELLDRFHIKATRKVEEHE